MIHILQILTAWISKGCGVSKLYYKLYSNVLPEYFLLLCRNSKFDFFFSLTSLAVYKTLSIQRPVPRIRLYCERISWYSTSLSMLALIRVVANNLCSNPSVITAQTSNTACSMTAFPFWCDLLAYLPFP